MIRRVSLPFLLEGWAEPIPDVRVAGLCSGSNRIAPGDAYVHLGSGGRQALRRARERGALAIIHDETLKVELPGVPAIGIADLAGRLPALAARFHHHPADALRIAAVATDGGPASPAWFIAQSWQRARGGAALVAPAGTGRFDALQPGPVPRNPLAVQDVLAGCLADGADMVALDVTTGLLCNRGLEEVAVDVAVYAGDETGGADDFLPLFADTAPRFAVVNHDAAAGKALARRAADGVQVLTFGSRGATELQGSVRAMDANGMTIGLAGPWGRGEIRTGLLGRRNLDGLLAAAGALALMGVPWAQVMHQVEIMRPPPGRMYCLAGEGRQPSAVIDHAHTPAALEEVLLSLRDHLHGRLYCVLVGAGANRAAMSQVGGALSDRLLESTHRGRGRVIRDALRQAGPGDIVLIAGAGRGRWAQRGAAEVRSLMEEAA
jgi:UDP-N-acetylmuramoyl-L-alanyl-D-glutamate--2,6-diaminopimelate ligase